MFSLGRSRQLALKELFYSLSWSRCPQLLTHLIFVPEKALNK